MKFICLGYMDEAQWDRMTESDRTALMEECFAYDDELGTCEEIRYQRL